MKVIGFDSWTRGAHHYQRLLESFRRRGIELTLVHLGSWGEDAGRAPQETLGGLPVRDISSYGRGGFPAVIDAERPAVVIFLSTDAFAHRAFNRYCRQRRLPTINLFNGLASVLTNAGMPAVFKVSITAQFRFAVSRIPKAVKKVWPTYALALLRTHATIGDWVRFARDIVRLTLGRFPARSADDARTDGCCVFVDADREYAMRKYGFAPENVVTVGNPDLIRFGLTSELIGAHLAGPRAECVDVMYVDTGLIFMGHVFDSRGEFIEHLNSMKQELEQQGRRLVIKLHPDHSRTDLAIVLERSGIEVCPNENFVPRLCRCCACIVEPSSLSLVPALLGMPLFLANYGKLREQRFGDLLISYPRGAILRDVREFNFLLGVELAGCDAERTMRWIEQNTGPLPAEEMPERVANVVLSLSKRVANR
jgi:hypothetical protein